MEDLYSGTITRARYGGIYETGRWVAFPCDPHELPADWDSDDVSALRFWDEHRHEIGGGDTPDAAWSDLLRKITPRND